MISLLSVFALTLAFSGCGSSSSGGSTDVAEVTGEAEEVIEEASVDGLPPVPVIPEG